MNNEIINISDAKSNVSQILNVATEINNIMNNVCSYLDKIGDEKNIHSPRAIALRGELEPFVKKFSTVYNQIESAARIIDETAERYQDL